MKVRILGKRGQLGTTSVISGLVSGLIERCVIFNVTCVRSTFYISMILVSSSGEELKMKFQKAN